MGVRVELLSKGSLDSEEEIVTRIPIRVYSINGDLTDTELDAAKQLLIDPITDDFAIDSSVLGTFVSNFEEATIIEVTPKPGVTDPHGQEVSRILENLIGREVNVSYSEQYLRKGHLNDEDFRILRKRLGHANPVINDYNVLKIDKNWNPSQHFEFEFPTVKIEDMPLFQYIDLNVSDEDLMKISDSRYVAMNLPEMKSIQRLFQGKFKGYEDFLERRKAVGLDAIPTDAEIEETGQSWSEHCRHKKLNGLWYYTSDDPNDESDLPEVVDSLFKTIIAGTTYKIAKHVDYLVSIFKDNSGVVRLNNKWNIAHKVETHNHPSSIDGFGGANTGTGGVLRDPDETGLGMIVVSSQYAFRFALPEDYPNLPDNVQDPGRTLETVVWGVEDYGNKMGIPTQYGDIMFDKGWLKPAVYVGAVAVQKAEVAGKFTHEKTVNPGYIGISLGGGVGKDGIHGATGSSESLKADSEERADVNQSVQIGNPIVEKE
ncbi:MAG: phosphoribosylformylglycinamidine synthase, partial [Nanoarchaeota archaeon]|nr:phosphoribosylformylglycinamidine synthase [Nanoarchaeota archaeon]